MNEFDKCNFCENYDSDAGCTDFYCQNKSDYRLDIYKLFTMADELGMSDRDLLDLIQKSN